MVYSKEVEYEESTESHHGVNSVSIKFLDFWATTTEQSAIIIDSLH